MLHQVRLIILSGLHGYSLFQEFNEDGKEHEFVRGVLHLIYSLYR